VTSPSRHIGTLREKPLHASLKRWYADDGDAIEVPVSGYVIDLVRDGMLIEVQTRGFSSMRAKVRALLSLGHRLRIVHPIAVNRWIVKAADDGAVIDRRLSPKHGRPVDLFPELVSFPDLVAEPNLDIDIVLTHEEEVRHHTPDRSWRRNGWSVTERRLIDVTGTMLIDDAHDLASLLPDTLAEPFTTGDLATALGVTRRTAQQMAYCLRVLGAIVGVDKHGNAISYRRCETTPSGGHRAATP
jgi:hypothetical protein